MKPWCATFLVFAISSALVHADVTIVQKTTLEGAMMAMAPGGAPSPTVTSKIKGQKARIDLEMANATLPMSTITDLAARQVILLMHDQKTARVALAGDATTPTTAVVPEMKIDASVTPTGKSQVIDGFKCDEYTVSSSVSMAEAGGANAPPEAAAMMKGLVMRMSGSVWIAKDVPGSAEYRTFQKAMAESRLGSPAMSATGLMPGADKMMKAMTDIDGIAYLTEIVMTIEGTGQMADMMAKMGPMRITTRVTSITTDPLSDDLFTIPAGYTTQ
jgi:hypothetical protein